jgi:SAM-dependent methyltransferase
MTEFDSYQRRYEETIDEAIGYTGKPQSFFTQVKAEYLSELFERKFDRDSRIEVLDIGCGNGTIHPMLLERNPGIRLCGVDVASTFIENARETNPQVQYEIYDGGRMPYSDARFDVAFTICVMHHVPPIKWPAFLDEMRRVVRPGGLISIIEHNPLNPLTRRLVDTCPFDQNAVLLRPSKLGALVRQAGFTNVGTQFIQFTPFGGPMFKRFDRLMGWLPLGAQYIVSGEPSR